MARPEIVCTIGPATETLESWQQLLAAGATAFRLPFAKETPEIQFARARVLSKLLGTSPSARILADLPGKAPRTANASPVHLIGGRVRLVDGARAPEREGDIPVSGLQAVIANVEAGTWLTFGDGELGGHVQSVRTDTIEIDIPTAGTLGQRRRVSWIGCAASTRSLGASDLALLKDPRIAAFTDILISYVRSAEPLERARAELGRPGVRLWAKIEDEEGLRNITEIAKTASAILIGQGDLLTSSGVEPFVRGIQDAAAWCKSSPIPLVVGTGILDQYSTGTISRAELGYLAMLPLTGVSGVMLSAETTIGDAPARAVSIVRAAFHRGPL